MWEEIVLSIEVKPFLYAQKSTSTTQKGNKAVGR